jgi:hypothetical protein
MSNHSPISFEEAKFSKGSHKLVIWTCPRCRKQFAKAYKDALKSKLCKPCNNIIRPKPDHSGANNPFFGKKHSTNFIETLKGSSNPNWSGGMPKCGDCGIELSDRRAEYCSKHHQLKDRNPSWNPVFDREKREQLRINPEYIAWAKAIKERDDFTCQECGKIGGLLHSHHLKRWSEFPKLRYDMANGVTLCKPCHQTKHKKIKLNR